MSSVICLVTLLTCDSRKVSAEEKSGSGELDLEGIDEDEIQKYILNEQEVQAKTELWMKQNEEYLKEQKEKEERIAKEKEQGIYKEKPKKPSKRREPIRASTAGEAIEKMLEQKKISSKINYDVLRDLNSKSISSPAKTEEAPGIVPGRKKLTRRKKQPNKSNLGLAKPASLMGKRLRPLISSNLKKKVAATQNAANAATQPSVPPEAPPDPTPPPVIESGPVTYEEAPEEEEEEEVEEPCVSAMKLMGENAKGIRNSPCTLPFNDFYVCPLKYVVMSANSPFVTVHSAVLRHGSAFSRSDDRAQAESHKAQTVDCGSRWPL
ncbi:Transcription factor IIIB 90 kDa subunit [Bagarius yarrelli]|uniref:Transcription factor IIIB 90 kDa subunit n=1 Tax=Bagarius yarrelli TaxID=175774 RepID=A0A556TSQ7_BAGYA|nr:Transcription factor IIIB 90 kDa subunit [Bagarius yarrelli]